MDDLIRKRSATDRMIIAKTLLESILQDMPTAEPRTGKWVLMSDCTGKYYACSWCGREGYSGMNYCPYCGAKMEEEHAGE